MICGRFLHFGSSLNEIRKIVQVLEKAAGIVWLNINNEKTKIIKLFENEDDTEDDNENIMFERVNEFQYLGVILSTKNDRLREIGVRIAKTERAAFALIKFLKFECFSKKTKTKLHTAKIRLTLTYWCEAWTTTSNTIRRIRTVENKI